MNRPQHEMPGDHTPAYGLRVRLETDRRCKCGSDTAVVGQGREPHAAELACERCGAHRGWLSHGSAHWISTVFSKFGAPTTPIVLRKR
jgi:hypothetical protein